MLIQNFLSKHLNKSITNSSTAKFADLHNLYGHADVIKVICIIHNVAFIKDFNCLTCRGASSTCSMPK